MVEGGRKGVRELQRLVLLAESGSSSSIALESLSFVQIPPIFNDDSLGVRDDVVPSDLNRMHRPDARYDRSVLWELGLQLQEVNASSVQQCTTVQPYEYQRVTLKEMEKEETCSLRRIQLQEHALPILSVPDCPCESLNASLSKPSMHSGLPEPVKTSCI